MNHKEQSFISKYIFSTDHKVIGKQFLWLGLFFLFFGGFQAMLIRWQLSYPDLAVPVWLLGNFLFEGGRMTSDHYNQLITMHGTIMIFWAITPLLIGAFGNFVIPLQIGAPDMVFPKLNMFSFWTFFLSGVVLVASYFLPGGTAAAGWTSYPPLSTPVGGIPGLGQVFWTLSITLMGAATMMGAINYITTIIRSRAPGMGYFKMPLTIWGLFLTSILNAIFVPVIAAGLILLLLDNVLGTNFFIAGGTASIAGGDPLLYQHVFWIFGHPEVYILILPAWGIVSDLLSVFSRKPAFGYKVTAICMCVIVALSTVVWGHHMYTTGMSPLLGKAFMFLTLLISIPSSIFFLNWLGTLWRGNLKFEPPMLFAIAVLWVFGLGGLTGLYNATVTSDIYLHDTMFVVGHFHYTMAASVLLGGLAAIYFWFPKMFGKSMNPLLGKLHFWASFIPLNLVFFNMMVMGYAGHHRRIFNPMEYEFLKPLAGLNEFVTTMAIILGAAQFIFVFNFIYSMAKGKKAEVNPWKAATLEWTVEAPIPHGNFAAVPTVYNGPHEYSHPGVSDRDWIAQSEPLPAEG
ncbi:MAG: cbb3-type cytochrome c oxidase subunit I [Candidatus Peribacteraceae bacterium]|jgi:cytochrome c oxidase subunit 1|nr:cbb3-type cytochrome c oxidase subunit I [Candidatus Peribacteraceae bacterium]|tara:strand:+ start:38 stop:1750 length:1713 start_codon:yes stop_codon:yes gene_type:complete